MASQRPEGSDARGSERGAPPLQRLEERLGYRFGDPELLRRALTHRSYAHEGRRRQPSNEVLEFLGDAVLGFLISRRLLDILPGSREGELSKHRAALVRARILATKARELGLGEHLLLGKGEEASGGRSKESLLADAFEAVVAALYQDGGLEVVEELLGRVFRKELDRLRRGQRLRSDPKTELQELLQGRGREVPTYRTLEERGPHHQREFAVALLVEGEELARGEGASKKAAEQAAARRALARLRQSS